MTRTVRAGRVFFSESERQAIEDLACEAPAEVGWSVTHWSQRSLALAAAEQEIVTDIHHTTIGDIFARGRPAPGPPAQPKDDHLG